MNGESHIADRDGSVVFRLGVLFGLFFIMLIALSGVALIIEKLQLSPRTEGLIVASLQCVLVFIIPTLIYGRTFSKKPLKYLEISSPLNFKQIIGIFISFLIGLPLLNQLIEWNASFSFPQSMKSIEELFRSMEYNAAKATEILLSTSSIGGLISGILVIGILTGFAEELFFRAGVQKAIERSGFNHHVSIWIAAFIFSILHFQFFGFVPRLLLGAFFGYLLYWSNSIWVSSFAHALNNSLVVATAWITQKSSFSFDIEKYGVMESGFPWGAILSAVIFGLFLYNFRNSLFGSSDKSQL